MRNVPFGIYQASINPLKNKSVALGHKYRDWVKAVGCRGANFRHCSNPRNTR